MKIHWKIDNRKLASARIRAAAAQGVVEAAEALLTNANTHVPIEEHTLEASGIATHDRENLTSSVSYNTPYARRQHEDTTLRHDPGRNAKWLENALRDMAPKYPGHIARKIKEAGA